MQIFSKTIIIGVILLFSVLCLSTTTFADVQNNSFLPLGFQSSISISVNNISLDSISPSLFIINGSPSSTTGNSGGIFNDSVNITNPTKFSITTNYTLSCPSGFTCSGDPTSNTALAIPANSSKSFLWTITIGGTSSSATVSLQVWSNSSAFSTAVTCSNCTISSSSSTNTNTNIAVTTASPTVAASSGSVVITIPLISAGETKTVSIPTTENVAITQLSISAKNSNPRVQITVSTLADKPSSITDDAPDKVFNYIQVDKVNITDIAITQADITFKVPKNWTTSNNVDASTISLYRYQDNAWNKLTTTKIGEGTDNFLYNATSPGLSVFAISGIPSATANQQPTTQTPNATSPETEGNATNPLGKKVTGKGAIISIIVVIILIIGGAVFYFVKKNASKPSPIYPKKTAWDELRKKYNKRL